MFLSRTLLTLYLNFKEAESMNASLVDGITIVLAVALMSMVVSPLLLLVLPDRLHQPQNIG